MCVPVQMLSQPSGVMQKLFLVSVANTVEWPPIHMCMHMYNIYIYIYIYMCVCVCVCVCNSYIYSINTVWLTHIKPIM